MMKLLPYLILSLLAVVALACGGGGGGDAGAEPVSTFLNLSKPTSDTGNFILIDVSGGPDATSYPVTSSTNIDILYSNESNPYMTSYIVLKEVTAGEFTMGSPNNSKFAGSNETSHKVEITENFYLGVYEVTQQQYRYVVGDNPSLFEGSVNPVELLSYNTVRGDSSIYDWPNTQTVDSSSFIGLLRAKTGLDIDLPTEAQWEYACRAGTDTPTYSGNNFLTTEDELIEDLLPLAFFDESAHADIRRTTPVGTYIPNDWGFYDMHGNVWEMCLDYYIADLGSSPNTDPLGPTSGVVRSLRGGAYGNDADLVRSAARANTNPANTNEVVGFRLVSRPN